MSTRTRNHASRKAIAIPIGARNVKIREMTSDLTSVQNKIALNLKTLTDTNEQHKQLLAFLETRQNDIEKADTTETAVRLNAESSALQISYATLAKIQDLSLLNYL